MIRHENFCLFDYDNIEINRQIYGSDQPPPYNLTAITAPVNLYYSKGDETATIVNAIELQTKLPNIRSSYLVPIDDFSHGDFIFHNIAKDVLYNRLIDNINKVNGKL